MSNIADFDIINPRTLMNTLNLGFAPYISQKTKLNHIYRYIEHIYYNYQRMWPQNDIPFFIVSL